MSVATRTAGLAPYLPSLGGRAALSVLCYHRVIDEHDGSRFTVTTRDLVAHLDAIEAENLPIVPLTHLEQHTGPAVSITFDDNSATHLTAARVLSDRGVAATFFLNPGELGGSGGLADADIAGLLELGMGIGAHGFRHQRLVEIDSASLAADVAACRQFLAERGQPLLWAYPGGDLGSYTPAQDRVLLDAGFDVRLTTLEGPYRQGRRDQARSRYVIRRDSSIRYVTAAARGGLQLVRVMKKARRLARRVRP